MLSTRCKAFTLVESLVALGIFALSISIILSLFVKSMHRISGVDAYARAVSLVGLMRLELDSIDSNEFGRMLDASTDSAVLFFSDADANRLYGVDSVGEDFFYIVEVDRVEQSSGGDLDVEEQGSSILCVRVSWPYHASNAVNADGVVLGVGGQFEFLATLGR